MQRIVFLLVWCVGLLASVAACDMSQIPASGSAGSSNSSTGTLADVPVYPNTKLLQPGENVMADTLAKNAQQAASVGQKLEQKIYTAPKDAAWDQIKKFYADKLPSAGWLAINVPIPDNELTKTVIWKKGAQNLTILHLTEPIKKDTFLLFSLSQ